MSAGTLIAEHETPADAAEPTLTEQMVRFAVVLATLLHENPKLPLLIWTIYPSGLVGRAVGRDDEDVTRKVRAWAQAFHVRAEVLCTAQNVARHRPGLSDGWVVEPGEIKAEIPAIGGDVVGELLEVKPGAGR